MPEHDNPMFPERSPKERTLLRSLKELEGLDSTVRDLARQQLSKKEPQVSGTSALYLQLNVFEEQGLVTKDGDPSSYSLTDEGIRIARRQRTGLNNMCNTGEKLLSETDPDQLPG